MSELDVSFVGSTRRLLENESLTFGRDADICVDDNPYLHRRLGLIHNDSGVWWIENTGDRIAMEIVDSSSRSLFVLSPKTSAAITFAKSVVRFEVAGSNYELELSQQNPPFEPRPAGASLADSSLEGQTIGLASVPLTDDQLRVLVVLCESVLNQATAKLEIPTNKAAALRLGWTTKAYGRKLDNVCDRLSRVGVRGLRGDSATVAKDRRLVLASHALEAGLVNQSDLSLLPD